MTLSYLQIGSWNIKHLGRQPTGSQRSQSVYALTDHIEMAGIDCLALQELYDTSEEGESVRRNEHLDQTCALLKSHTGDDWEYVILENRRASDTSQLCGVLWNAAVLGLERTLPVPVAFQVGDKWLWDRRPHVVTFATRAVIEGRPSRFSIVPLHMKANGSDAQARRKRALEARELAGRVDWIIERFGDESLILLGDTNCLGAWEQAVETFIDAGFIDLNADDVGTYAGSGRPFDRIFVREGRPEYRYSRQYVLRAANPDAHLAYLSDHYLIKTSVKAYVDRD